MARSRLVRAVIAIAVLGPLLVVGNWALSGSSGPKVPESPAAKGVYRIKGKKPVKPTDAAAKPYRPGKVKWPSTATGVAGLNATKLNLANPAAGRTRVPGTPVWAQPVPSADGTYKGPSRVAVKVAAHSIAESAGVTGMVFTATPQGATTPAGSGSVRIGVDYAAFAHAFGGNYGSRLRLVQLPACAVTTPQMAGCRKQTPLAGAGNYVRGANVYATLPATSAGGTAPVVLAVTSTAATGSPNGDGGDGGTYNATDLKPSGSWTAGGSSGSFTYGYPIQTPPAASTLVPSVGLSYDSASVDGQTASTQAQANWLGDGWSTPQSYIEQSFKPCSDKPEGRDAPKKTNDQCYDGKILTLSLNGSSTALVWDEGKQTYTPADDNGSVVKRVTGSGNGSGTHDTDYWQVTDQTGTVFLFGRNQLPGWTSGKPTTNSVDSQPVFSAFSGDPCYDATWASSVCTMAYRWNLDYVKDLHGNAMSYYYKQDTNAYAQNADTSGSTTPKATATYVRDSHLDHIDYGFVDGQAYTANSGHAPNQVWFTIDGRCSQGGVCPAITSANASSFPDVPYDLKCDMGANCLVTSPSHYSTVRLTGIKTQQWTGSAYSPVDSWAFTQTMPPTGDGMDPTLWLSSIVRTGADTTAGGSAVTLPSTSFTPTQLVNRVDTTHDGLPPMIRMRIGSITTETGATIGVGYTRTNPCTAPVSLTPATNTSSCYPVYWTPQGSTAQILDWFNKWQVSSVTTDDPTGASPTQATNYTYLGGGAWHYDDNELVKAKNRTYGQWRGFKTVQTFTGQGNDTQTKAEATYYRGMSLNGPTTGPVVNLTDSQGGVHEDIDQLSGNTLESTSYNYSGGQITGSTINSYWVSSPTATRARTGLKDLTANTTGQVESWTREAITSGGTTTWRKTETDTTFDTSQSSPTFGMPTVVYAHGDLAETDQRRCTTTTYVPANTTLNLAGLPQQVETIAKACGGTNPGGNSAPTSGQVNALTAPASVNRPAEVVSAQRTIYDNPNLAKTWPQPASSSGPIGPLQGVPTLGEVSETQVANDYTGGAYSYQVKTATVYDSYGRAVDTYDPLGHKTHATFTMANGLTTGTTITNALGQSSSATYDPLRGSPLTTTDSNTTANNVTNNTSNVTTTTRYDGLGRITAAWGAERPTTSPANALFTYDVSKTAPTAVTTKVMNDGSGYVTSIALYDAALRPRQTQQPTPKGGRLVTDTFYDTRGWTWKTNQAWWDSGSSPATALAGVPDSQVPNQTVTAFDGVGRSVLTTSYSLSQVKEQAATAYLGNKTISVPLNASGQPFTGGTATATVSDAVGRTTELDKYTTAPTVTVSTGQGAASPTTVSITGGTSQATTYSFNAVGQQTDVKDVSTGAVWNTTYNLLGQPVAKDDPDAGASTMTYDAAGNIVQTTDARKKTGGAPTTLSFTYDPLNRKTGQYAAPLTGQTAGNQMASWLYDNRNPDGSATVAGLTYPIGHLTTSTSYVGGSGSGGNAYTTQSTGYNVFGEPLGSTVTLPSSEGQLAGAHTVTQKYSSTTGLPWRTVYPASPATTATPAGNALPAETVTTGYATALDLPATSTGLSQYAVNTTYTALGQIGQAKLGKATGSQADLTNTYDPHTGALTDTQLTNTAVSSTPIDHTTYTYDPAGNPTSQTNTRQGSAIETQCFGYDTLDRLKQAWTATDNCAADPAGNNGATVGSGITGGAYWTSWTFDPLGQRKTQTEHGLNSTPDATTTYTYGNAGNQPHTLTATSTTKGSATTASSFSYDEIGNTTQRTTPDKGQQSLTWSDAGQLTAVTDASGGSSYIYDGQGELLLQKNPTTTTLYLPGEQLVLNTATQALTGTRYYALPGGGQVVRTGTGNNYSYQTGDPHGTADLTIDPGFTTPTWRQQTPYGAPRGTTPATWPDNHGFLGKPQDTTTGLTDVGARWYDPINGRFTSLDPIFDPESPQEHNGYTYAASNPISGSDPSGLKVDGCEVNNDCSQTPNTAGGGSNGSIRCDSYCGNTTTHGGAIADGSDQRARIWSDIARLIADAVARRRLALKAKIAEAAKQAAIHGYTTSLLPATHDSTSADPTGITETSAGDVLFDILLGDASKCASGSAWDCLSFYSNFIPGPQEIKLGGKLAELSPKLGRLIERLLEGGAKACKLNSFVPDTKVLMADGKSKPIEHIKVGDKISNALPGEDPGTPGQVHEVTAIHITRADRDYTDVTITTNAGRQTIKGTTHHLYWEVTARRWTEAGQLRIGDKLQTTGGYTATIIALRTHAATAVTYNLTIDGLHAYYVEAGTTRVLVHNDGSDPRFQRLDRPGYTNYTLVDGSGKAYYSGMFGPNETVASVLYRHSKNNNRFSRANGDDIRIAPGTRTYGQSRLMEQRMAEQYGTIIGKAGNNYRGNRQNPLDLRKLAEYERYEARKLVGGC